MRRNSSVSSFLITALCFQIDALINSAHPSRGQSTTLLLHQQRDSEFEYDSYYYRNDVQHRPHFNVPDASTSISPTQQHQFEKTSTANVDLDQYDQGTIHNKVIGKTNTAPNTIMNMLLSQVFPNQPKNVLPNNPTETPRVSLPDLHQIISEDDLQKITSRAVSGGKFVSSLIQDILLNTAKMAIGALESNKTSETMQSTSYNDVCEFDDELCREIEEALAATESFNILTEKSRERSSTLDIPAATDRVNEGVSSPLTRSKQIDKNSAKEVSEYYFATADRSSSIEDYYKRALEQQLVGIDQAQSKMQIHQEIAPSEQAKLVSSQLLDDNALLELHQRDKAKITRSTARIDEQFTNPSRNDNSSASKSARSSDSSVPVGASRPHDARYESRKIVPDDAPDSIRLHITDEALAFVRSLNLDVYEIYLSTRTPGSNMSGKLEGPMAEDVLTLDDAIWYCDRMKIGRMHRIAERRHRTNNDETVGSPREQSQQLHKMRNYPTKERQLNARNESIDRGQVRRRSDVAMRSRERYTVTREPRFVPRDYDKRSINSRSNIAAEDRVPRFRQYPREKPVAHSNFDPPRRRHDKNSSSMSRLIATGPTKTSQGARSSRKKTMSTVSLAKLIQGPKEMDAAQVSTNRFREPYQEAKQTEFRPPAWQSQPRENLRKPQREMNFDAGSPRIHSSQPSLRELSERHAPPVSTSKTSAYYTESALEMAQRFGINLENVSSGSDDPITSDDVKHYIESRKSIRANRLNQFPSQRDSQYIDSELTYEEFSAYFNSETASKLQQHQKFSRDISGTT
jgi:hypothetical protein